ncbi:hypothetical protein C8Q76DRAFT_732556 [Earliella scabrosa]|nr:hypothetical protein C8Q76DRAFT_732556 [Earliella scabrosa]
MWVLVSRLLSTLVLLALGSTLVSATLPAHEHQRVDALRRHHAVNLTQRGTHLEKRFDKTRFTYFEVGQNACGSYDQDSDFIVALNIEQWAGGSHCYAPITVFYKGKSAQAKITDECPSCPHGALDLSPSLFSFLADGLDAGEVYGSWVFGSGEEPKPAPPPPPKPKPSPTIHTHKAARPPPSPSPSPSPSSTSTSIAEDTPTPTAPAQSATSTTQSLASSVGASPSSTISATSVSPTATVTSFDQGTLNQVNLAVLQLAGIMLAAPGSA